MLSLFLNYKPFPGQPSLGYKNLTRADHNNYCKCHAPAPTPLHPLQRMQCRVHLLIVFKKLSGFLTEAKVHLFSALKSRLFVDGTGWISGGWWINKEGSGHTASLLFSQQYFRILSKRYILHSRESPVADTRGSLSTSDGDHTPHCKHCVSSSAVAVFLRKTTPGWSCSKHK